MNDSFRFYKDSTILSVRPFKFHVNFFWAKHVVLHNIYFELSLVVHVKNDFTPSNVNITKLYGTDDVIKNKTGSTATLNNLTVVCPVICYSIYH